MNQVMTVLFAGAMMATVALAQDDFGTNARFHQKTGRDLPGVTASANAGDMCCAMTSCRMAAPEPAVSHSDGDVRFHAKTGRYTSNREAAPQASAMGSQTMPAASDAEQRSRAKTGRYVAAATASDCVQMSCCKRHA